MEILSEKELLKIVNNSYSLSERISNFELQNNDKIDNNYLINELLNLKIEEWCQVTTQGNWEKFEDRLALDGLDLNKVRSAFAYTPIINKEDIPSWAETINEVIKAISLFDIENLECELFEKYLFINPDEPVPFEEFFLPFIYVAKQRLVGYTGSNYHLLSEKAHASMERNLLKRLSNLCSRCLQSEFLFFRTLKQSQLFKYIEKNQNIFIKDAYKKFIKKMYKDSFCSFFKEYSVLAKLAAILTELWVDATKEFLVRLATDWDEIQTLFQEEDKKTTQIISVNPGISDYHCGGRSVISLTFNSGLKLIYKPRKIDIEYEFFNFISWINHQNELLDLKIIKIIKKSNYGWVEFVDSALCEDECQVGRYYQRSGMLLCLVRVLKGTDFHYENIIAYKDYPVLFDLETLLHNHNQVEEDKNSDINATYIANQEIVNSVLITHLLPHWECGIKGQSFDVSGLGGVGDQETYFHPLKFKNINTDQMTASHDYGKTLPQNNLPLLKSPEFLLSSYVEKIVDGFQQMHSFLVNHREQLLTVNSPLEKLAHQKVRFVFRNTGNYWSILNNSLNPKFVRNGIDRSIYLDILNRDLLLSNSKSNLWSLLKAEHQALEYMDIPIFTSCPNSNDLTINQNHKIDNFFAKPSLYRVIDCLNNLNDKDLEKQVNFIRGAVYSRVASKTKIPPLFDSSILNRDLVTPAPLTEEEILQQAISIATNLNKQAILSDDGSATWITLGQIAQANRFEFQPMGYSLYDGCCGVALFLAALEKITGGCGFRDLTFAALQTLRKHLQDFTTNQEIAKEIGIGGAVGLGSIIYALVRISQFLGETTLLEDAIQVASLITSENILADQNLDIIGGSAGTILGLLTLYKITADQKVLEQAINCGCHLLNKRVTSKSGYKTWPTLNSKLLTGFAHGAAGIAYALLKLYETTQDHIFLEAAKEAIAYERSVFSFEMQNWPDLRSSINNDGKPNFMSSWCHGAPGIGLARLGSLSIIDDPEVRHEVEVAFKTIQKSHLRRIDTLCCGNFGLMDILLVGYQKLSIRELLETCIKQTSSIITRAEKTNFFLFLPNLTSGVYIPGLFQGTSGIGYELLRVANPNLLPSILLWE